MTLRFPRFKSDRIFTFDLLVFCTGNGPTYRLVELQWVPTLEPRLRRKRYAVLLLRQGVSDSGLNSSGAREFLFPASC